MSDDLIPLLIILFLFSQVSERLGNVIKLHIVDRFIPNVPNDPYLEKSKEKKTILTSFISGFLITLIFEFNVRSDVSELTFLGDDDVFAVISRLLLGTLLLAFGSKFWHDMLDLVFYYKKVKQISAGGNLHKFDEVKLLEEHVDIHGSELARRCMYQNANLLDKIPNSSYGIMPLSKNGKLEYVIAVFCDSEDDKKAISVPPFLTYRSHSGIIYQVPIEIIVTGETVTQQEPIRFIAGEAIANAQTPSNKGTFGCLMMQRNSETNVSKAVILTCYHVVKIKGMSWEEFIPKDSVQSEVIGLTDNNAIAIGTLKKGERTRFHDIALIQPSSLDNVENIVYQTISIPQKFRKVTSEDVEKNIRVRFRGINAPADRVAKLIAREYPERIKYPGDKDKHLLSNLLVISANVSDYENPSAGGDSGAIVYDDDNYAIGMIVAGNKKFGFAIPFSEIVDQYNLETLTS